MQKILPSQLSRKTKRPVVPLSLLLSLLLVLGNTSISFAGVPYQEGAERTPVTTEAKTFISECEGQQWLLDETERILNQRQKTIDRLKWEDLDEITSIGLQGKGVQGKIPKAIGRFKQVEHIFLSGNRLSGDLPDELFTLPHLKNLDLSDNLYQGQISDKFKELPELEVLRLAGNQYTTVPTTLFDGYLPSHLITLDLARNRLNHPIPKEIAQLHRLEYLSLSQNPFGDILPRELTTMNQLKVFSCHSAKLTGELPTNLGDMTSLMYFDVGKNNLEKEIPLSVGSLQNLREFTIADNQIKGLIPDLFSGMTALEEVHLDKNNLRGYVPGSLYRRAADHGTKVTFAQNYLTGQDALRIEQLSGVKVSEGNFLDQSTGQQYQLTSPYVHCPKGQATDLHSYLRNVSVNGSGPFKAIRPYDEYIISIESGTGSGISVSSAGGLFVTLNEEITYGNPAKVKIQIKDNHGSAYSTCIVSVGTEPAPVTGGGGGGAAGGAIDKPTPTEQTNNHNPYLLGYPDKTVKADREVTREEAAVILTRIIEGMDYAPTKATDASFLDVKIERWSSPYIEYAKREALLQGYPEGDFKPSQGMSRNEFAALLVRWKNLPLIHERPADFPLTDVPDNWAAPYIYTAYEAGYITGYPDQTFRGEGKVTRAETASMVNGALERKPVKAFWDKEEQNPYPDLTKSHWAYYELMESSIRHPHE